MKNKAFTVGYVLKQYSLIFILVILLSACTSIGKESNEQSVPKTADAFLERGILFASQGNFVLAIMDFTEALNSNPNLSTAYLLRGRALYASISRNIFISDNFSEVTSIWSYSLNSSVNKTTQIQIYEQAMADINNAQKLDPDNIAIYTDRGNLYFLFDETEKAISDYTQAIRLNPNDAKLYHNRAKVYYRISDYDRAITDYTQAIRLEPNNADWYYQRADAYNRKRMEGGRYEDQIIADLTQAIRLDSSNAYLYDFRGSAYNGIGDYDRAIIDHTQAIKLDPNDELFYYFRGNAYYNKGNYDQAIADYTQAMQLSLVASSFIYSHRGDAYVKKGDYDRAIADYTEAIRLESNDTSTKERLENALKARGDQNK